MSSHAYTHYPGQGCPGTPPVGPTQRARTMSCASCPGVPATPPRYDQGCPLPRPGNFGGWPKTGQPVHAATHAVARHARGWCSGPGYLPGCPNSWGFSITQPLPPPCAYRRKIRAFVADPHTRQVCAWLVFGPRLPRLVEPGNPPPGHLSVSGFSLYISTGSWLGYSCWGIFVWPAQPCPNRCPLSCRCHRSNGYPKPTQDR
jgi:hypothetical protein